MKRAILYHCGNPGRIPEAVRQARLSPLAITRVFAGLMCDEARQLHVALAGAAPLYVDADATDTLTEVTRTAAAIRSFAPDRLLVVTEPGHLRRAVLIARIIYLGSGIQIIGCPAADGGYRSPFRRTVLDILRAGVYRLTGIEVML